MHSVKVIHPLRSKIINVASGYQKIESNYLFLLRVFFFVGLPQLIFKQQNETLFRQTNWFFDFIIYIFLFLISHIKDIFPFFLRRQIMFKWCRYPFYFLKSSLLFTAYRISLHRFLIGKNEGKLYISNDIVVYFICILLNFFFFLLSSIYHKEL